MIKRRRLLTFITVMIIVLTATFMSLFPFISNKSLNLLDDALSVSEGVPILDDFVCFTNETYGNSSIIISNGQSIIINCGSIKTADALINQLKELKISAISCLIITHPAARNTGGFKKLTKEFNIHNLYICGVFGIDPTNDSDLLNLVAIADSININTRYITSDTSFDIGNAKFDIFCQQSENSRKSDNAPAIKITSSKNSFLFINELSDQAESSLYEKDISADILVVSGTINYEGISNDLIELINPKTAVFSLSSVSDVELENNYCKRILDKSISVYKTSILGNIYISFENSNDILHF